MLLWHRSDVTDQLHPSRGLPICLYSRKHVAARLAPGSPASWWGNPGSTQGRLRHVDESDSATLEFYGALGFEKSGNLLQGRTQIIQGPATTADRLNISKYGYRTTRVVSWDHPWSPVAATRLKARYLPPIRRGDLPRVIAEGLGLLDHRRRVWTVFGSISHGDLCGTQAGHPNLGCRFHGCPACCGMPVGWNGRGRVDISEYAEGHLRRDDEVALLFDPRDLRAITIPLVNIRWALQPAIEEGVLSGSAEAALLELAHSVRFKVRSHEELLEAVSGSPWGSEIDAARIHATESVAHEQKATRRALAARGDAGEHSVGKPACSEIRFAITPIVRSKVGMTISKPLPPCPVQARNWRRYKASDLLPNCRTGSPLAGCGPAIGSGWIG